MQRKKKTDEVKRLRGDKLHEFEPLRQQCVRWALDNLEAIKATDPDVPEYLGDRAADNWRTLLAIADVAGWTEVAVAAIEHLVPKKAEDDDYGVKLLADIKEIFENDGGERMSSADIVEALNEIEESPWPGFFHGKGINPQRVAKMLGEYKIKPYVQRIDGSKKTARGYQKEAFIEIWSVYLSDPAEYPNLDVTVKQRSNGGTSSDFLDVTGENNVTPGNGLEPPSNKDCYGVTPKKGVLPDSESADEDTPNVSDFDPFGMCETSDERAEVRI